MHAKVDGQPEKGETVTKLSRVLAVVAALVWTSAGAVSAQEWRMVGQDENVIWPVEQFKAVPLTARVASASEAPGTRTPRVKPFLPMDPDAYRSAKLRAQQAFERDSAAPAAPSAGDVGIRAVTIQNGPGLPATLNASPSSPPDTTGAIGPLHYVQMVNQLIGVFDRDLRLQNVRDLAAFTDLGGMFEAFDPQILWDQRDQRWFYVVLGDIPGDAFSNHFAFGWSKTADPTDLLSGWCHYAFDTGNRLLDYPKLGHSAGTLGHDEGSLWIGVNQYDSSTTPLRFLSAGVMHIPKPPRGDITSCGPGPDGFLFFNEVFPMLNEDGTMAFSPVVANVTDPNGPVTLSFYGCFIVAAHNALGGPQNKIMVWRGVNGPAFPGIIADGDLTVLEYDVPANVPQPGTINTLETHDARLTQAVAHVDPDVSPPPPLQPRWAVWTQHTVRGPVVANSVVRHYEIVHTGETPRNFINRQGEILSDTDFVFNGAISPSSRGNDPVIIYNRASSTLLPIVAARTEDPGEVILAESVGIDIDRTCDNPSHLNICRWGDYAGATPDPVFPGVVWGTNQFNGPADPTGAPSWRTQIFAVQ